MGLLRADIQTIATRTGAKVVAAWSTRDAGTMGTVQGVVMHHTGSSQASSAIAPTLAIVRDGRSDLANALSSYYIDKAGTIYCITEKIAWHAGVGAFNGITDANGHMLGIEAESDGVVWTTATVNSYVALVAEILRFIGKDVTWAVRHADWALPKGRKTDFAGLNEADFRARVTARLNGTATPEDDVPLTAQEISAISDAIANRGLGAYGAAWQTWNAAVAEAKNATTAANKAASSADAAAKAIAGFKPASVSVDAGAVASALASDSNFLAALAAAVNDAAAKRLAS